MPRRSALQPWVVLTAYSGSVEQTRLGRRPAPRLPGSYRRGAFLIEVGENPDCNHFIGEWNSCELVAGPVSPDGWCMLWTGASKAQPDTLGRR